MFSYQSVAHIPKITHQYLTKNKKRPKLRHTTVMPPALQLFKPADHVTPDGDGRWVIWSKRDFALKPFIDFFSCTNMLARQFFFFENHPNTPQRNQIVRPCRKKFSKDDLKISKMSYNDLFAREQRLPNLTYVRSIQSPGNTSFFNQTNRCSKLLKIFTFSTIFPEPLFKKCKGLLRLGYIANRHMTFTNLDVIVVLQSIFDVTQKLKDVQAIERRVKKCVHTFERSLQTQRSPDHVTIYRVHTCFCMQTSRLFPCKYFVFPDS